jgi:hypothetical protein
VHGGDKGGRITLPFHLPSLEDPDLGGVSTPLPPPPPAFSSGSEATIGPSTPGTVGHQLRPKLWDMIDSL